jgi:hypothetical protein
MFQDRPATRLPMRLRPDYRRRVQLTIYSVEIERSLQCFFHDSQDFGRQRAEPFGELCAIQRGHFLAAKRVLDEVFQRIVDARDRMPGRIEAQV